MPKTCTYDWNGKAGKAQWSLEEDTLLLMPESGAPLPFAVKELSGISGDGFSLDLRVPGAVLKLSKLGQDGPTLLEQLRAHLAPPSRRCAAAHGNGDARSLPLPGLLTRRGETRGRPALRRCPAHSPRR